MKRGITMQTFKINKLVTIILIFIICILLIFASNNIYKKFLKVGNTKYNAKIENNENRNINLSNEDKENINQKLNYSIQNPLRIILNFESLDIDYETNLLNEEKNRFEIAWQNILKDANYSDKISWNLDENGQEKVGNASINYDEFKAYYEKILDNKLDEENLRAGNIYNGILIKDNNLYGSYIENWNNSEFVLKANNLSFNKASNIYTLNVDFLTSLNSDKTINYDNLSSIYSYDVLNYDSNVKYANLEIKYKKVNNEYKLLSIIFNE